MATEATRPVRQCVSRRPSPPAASLPQLGKVDSAACVTTAGFELLRTHSNTRMASLEELKDALRDTLAARGSLGQIQARVRAEIFSALEESVRIGVRVRGGGFARGV